ncbi:MAG: energy transducer TonB [Desulfobacterales bacterium]|nr:energy transducer TonB [Desulfobacterales bacterium]
MAHLFNAGMALHPERFEAHGVRGASAADIFADAVAADESGREAPPSGAFDPKRPDRWGLAVLGALALHLLLLAVLLSASNREQILPSLGAAPSRVITISLVEMPAIAGAAQPSAPLPPAPAVVRKRPVTPKPEASRPPPSTKTQRPAPQPANPMVVEAASPDGLPENTASADGRTSVELPSRGDDGVARSESVALAQASVPLYDLNPPPVYPPAARRRNLQGTVLLEVLVDREGQAAKVEVLRGSGHELLDHSALDSVRQWRFAPARRGGRTQEMWVQVPVRFQLQ